MAEDGVGQRPKSAHFKEYSTILSNTCSQHSFKNSVAFMHASLLRLEETIDGREATFRGIWIRAKICMN